MTNSNTFIVSKTLTKIEKYQGDLKENLCYNSIKDLQSYGNLCGIIKGLEEAKHMLNDTLDEYNKAETQQDPY